MEYALEGYGFSAARVVRSMLGREPGKREDAYLLEMLALDLGRHLDGFAERVIKGLLPQGTFQRPPELLSTLRPLGPQGPMNGLALRVASAAKAAFDALRPWLALRLTACSLEAEAQGCEHLLLGVYSPTIIAEVQADDCVAAGALVALQGEPGRGYRLEVLPRVYRKVCQNGLIFYEGETAARELDPRLLLEDGAPEPLASAIEKMLRDCFDEKDFSSAATRFRESASAPIDYEALTVTMSDALSLEVEQSVLERLIAEGDFTRWGLLNAITAEARTAPSSLMLQLERLGGAIARLPVAAGPVVRGAPGTDASLAETMRSSLRQRKKAAAA